MRWVWKDRKLRAHAGALRYAEVVTAQPLAIQASEPVHELDGVGMEASEDLQHDRLARVAAAGGGVVRLLDQLVLLVGRVAEGGLAAKLTGAGRARRDGRDDLLLVEGVVRAVSVTLLVRKVWLHVGAVDAMELVFHDHVVREDRAEGGQPPLERLGVTRAMRVHVLLAIG